MKMKFLLPIICSIIVGFLLGKVFFSEYDKNGIPTFNEGEKLYFVQIGVYSSLESLKENNQNYEEFLYILEEDGYHLYVGITKIYEIANKIKEYHTKNGNNIYIKEKVVNNNSFLSILTEYDKITTIASNNKDIADIEKIVISNYKEMIMNE